MIPKVFKIGGSVIENASLMDSFCRDFASVPGPKALVHGGGVMASQLQQALGQEPVKIEGRRVTDEDALKAVTMTYAGWCNKILVATLQKYGCNAIGLCGCDASVIKAAKRPARLLRDGVTLVDYGLVGDVKPCGVDAGMLNSLIGLDLVPVLSPINHDGKGQLLNTNADTVAGAVAAALGAELCCCFEMDGVLSDISDPSSVISRISAERFEEMKREGAVADGMIPKIENCLEALRCGAAKAVIMNACAISGNGNAGTEIVL